MIEKNAKILSKANRLMFFSIKLQQKRVKNQYNNIIVLKKEERFIDNRRLHSGLVHIGFDYNAYYDCRHHHRRRHNSRDDYIVPNSFSIYCCLFCSRHSRLCLCYRRRRHRLYNVDCSASPSSLLI